MQLLYVEATAAAARCSPYSFHRCSCRHQPYSIQRCGAAIYLSRSSIATNNVIVYVHFFITTTFTSHTQSSVAAPEEPILIPSSKLQPTAICTPWSHRHRYHIFNPSSKLLQLTSFNTHIDKIFATY
mmetsp:Transcript_9944/g.13630  ORF Transcript_9944/g.13630 Transcript_9944/m.13630 type:complete len:127 (+) Transcript_9944:143-523(+)